MIQIETNFFNNQVQINEYLRLFQKTYPNRKILNVNVVPNDPMGWFTTIMYEVTL